MNKLILTQIMKNEAHVAHRMLDSIKPIIDGICIVDTGSTDNSIEVVRKWAMDNNIECHIFEKPFDNFENVRNESLNKAREIYLKNNDNHTYYGIWLDFDEVINIEPNFNKESLNKDIYMVNTVLNNMKYTRNEIFRLDKSIKFYGPVHEFLISEEDNTTSNIIDGISVYVRTDGGSWKENLPNKYLKHAHLLEQYISNDRSDPRWIFYTAQSYHDSACIKDNRTENEERLRRSLKYYKERITLSSGYFEEISYSQYRIGYIMNLLEEPWHLTMQEFLKAHNLDPLKADPIKAIIDHYISVNEWHLAYIYTKFGVEQYHNKNPYPKRILYIDQSLYDWKFLEVHSATCYYLGKNDEAITYFKQLLELTKNKKELFSESDIMKIESNVKHFLK